MKLFRGPIPVFCALLAGAGAARAGFRGCWLLQPNFEGFPDNLGASERWEEIPARALPPRSIRGLLVVISALDAQATRFIGQSADRRFAQRAKRGLFQQSWHTAILAEQHPRFTPAAARRTAGSPSLPRVTKQKGLQLCRW